MEKQLFIKIKGELVSVTEEVYLAYYSMEAHERYLERKDTNKGKVLYGDMDTDDMAGEEAIPDLFSDSVEDIVIKRFVNEQLHICIGLLPKNEQELIKTLFFDGKSEREVADLYGISQPAVHKRKTKALEKLKKFMDK